MSPRPLPLEHGKMLRSQSNWVKFSAIGAVGFSRNRLELFRFATAGKTQQNCGETATHPFIDRKNSPDPCNSISRETRGSAKLRTNTGGFGGRRFLIRDPDGLEGWHRI